MKILNDTILERSSRQARMLVETNGSMTIRPNMDCFIVADIYASSSDQPYTYDVYCETLHQWSDRTMKENITDAGLTTEDIAALPVVRFNFIGKDEQRIGTIAQEVQKVCPELVKADKAGRLTLDYATLGAVIGIECAKEIVALRNEIEQLKSRINDTE